MSKRAVLSIGELSRRTGLATSALRYYERLGLVTPAGRLNGRRYYGLGSAEQIGLVGLYQDAGFTLGEIGSIVRAGSRRNPSWARLMEAKVHALERAIVDAARAKALIEHALACRHRELPMCPRFRAALNARLVLMGTSTRRRTSLRVG